MLAPQGLDGEALRVTTEEKPLIASGEGASTQVRPAASACHHIHPGGRSSEGSVLWTPSQRKMLVAEATDAIMELLILCQFVTLQSHIFPRNSTK